MSAGLSRNQRNTGGHRPAATVDGTAGETSEACSSTVFRLLCVADWRFSQHVAAASSVRPIFPCAPRLRRIGFVTGCSRRNLTVREGLVLADLHRGQLDTRIAWEIHRNPDDLDDGSRPRRESVAAHQYDIVVAETMCQITTLGHVPDQKVGVPEVVGNIPDRHVAPDEACGVDNRP